MATSKRGVTGRAHIGPSCNEKDCPTTGPKKESHRSQSVGTGQNGEREDYASLTRIKTVRGAKVRQLGGIDKGKEGIQIP